MGNTLKTASKSKLNLKSVQQIWGKAAHNAFTDLVAFKDALWCVFREGSAHVSPDGAFRILKSSDGFSWQNVGVQRLDNADLRDAKLIVSKEGNLQLFGAGALHDKSLYSHQSYMWQSSDGINWSQPLAIGEQNIWQWRMLWQQNTLYSLGYKVGSPHFIRLYQSQNAQKFTPISTIYSGSYANESALLFGENKQAYCLLRRDPEHGLFGTSSPPYDSWQWQDIGCRIGGPQWVELPNGQLLACVRLYDEKIRTSLCWIDKKTGLLTEALTLPSAGDCSYAGMVLQKNTLYVSYYSSHEKNTAIYLAVINISA